MHIPGDTLIPCSHMLLLVVSYVLLISGSECHSIGDAKLTVPSLSSIYDTASFSFSLSLFLSCLPVCFSNVALFFFLLLCRYLSTTDIFKYKNIFKMTIIFGMCRAF